MSATETQALLQCYVQKLEIIDLLLNNYTIFVFILKIMNFTLRSWLAVSVDVCTCISNEDTLELVGFVAKRNGPCVCIIQ